MSRSRKSAERSTTRMPALAQRGDGRRGGAVRVGDDRGVDPLEPVEVELGQLERHPVARVEACRAACRRRCARSRRRAPGCGWSPDDLGRQRAGEAGGAGNQHPRGGIAAQWLGIGLTHAARPRSRPASPRSPRAAPATSSSVRVRSRGAELEAEGQALAPLAQLLALVEVEDLGRAQQLAAAGEDRLADGSAATIGRNDDGEVLVGGRESGDVLVGLLARGGGGDQRRRVEFEGDRGLEVPGPADQRVDLAEPADRYAADRDRGGATGMQERLGCRRELQSSTPSWRASASATPFSAKKSAGSPPPRQERREQRPDRQAGEPVRLGERRRLLVPRTHPASTVRRRDGARRAGMHCRPSKRAMRSVPRATLREATSSREPSSVVRIAEWSSESGLASSTVSWRGSSAGIRSRPASPGSVKLQPTTWSKPRSRSTSSARRRRRCSRLRPPTSPRRRGQRRRQVLVDAVDPGHLLDQVDLAGDVVVAVGRDLDLEVIAVGRDPEAEPLQVGGLVGLGDRHPQQALDPGRPQVYPPRLGDLGGDVDRPRHQLRPAELDQQPRGDPLRPHAQLRVQLLLEPRGGLRAQPEQTRGAEDVGAVPVGDLEQDPGGLAETSETAGRP